jgi:hypothetical protein
VSQVTRQFAGDRKFCGVSRYLTATSSAVSAYLKLQSSVSQRVIREIPGTLILYIYYRTKFQEPTLRGATLPSTLEVRITIKLILLIVGI